MRGNPGPRPEDIVLRTAQRGQPFRSRGTYSSAGEAQRGTSLGRKGGARLVASSTPRPWSEIVGWLAPRFPRGGSPPPSEGQCCCRRGLDTFRSSSPCARMAAPWLSAAFTMRVYGHGSEELQREATERFAALSDA